MTDTIKDLTEPPNLYFYIIPNCVEDDIQDPYLFRLYCHYSRVGMCTEAISTTAKTCGMSETKARTTRNVLHKLGYITVTPQWDADNGRTGNRVQIVSLQNDEE